MRLPGKTFVAVLMAMAMICAAAGTATANRGLEHSVASGELGRIEATSRAVTFTDEEGTFSIVCEIIIVMSLHRGGVLKTLGLLRGTVIGVIVRNCRGGTVTILTGSLPWHKTHVSFRGTLPNITGVQFEIRGIGFLVSAFFGLGRCLYGGSIQLTTGGGTTITEMRMVESRSLPLVTNLGGFECPAGGVFRGTFSVAPNVRMRLV